MVNEHEQYLYFPLFVLVLGSIVIYIIQVILQRSTIRDALLTEIKLILNHVRDTYDYLAQPDHYWLRANQVLTRAPTDTKLTTRTFSALLPQAHLLGKYQVIRILHFYAHYERCENLKISLFQHIRNHVESGTPLTEMDIHVLNIRRLRLCQGYQSLLGNPERVVDDIYSLSPDYSIPSTKEIAKHMNSAVSPTNDHVN